MHETAPGVRPAPARADPAGGGLVRSPMVNIAHEAVDRHAAGPAADRCAVRFVSRSFRTTDVSYRELSHQANRCANVLRALGVAEREAVFVLLPRSPALYTAVLGALKAGALSCPLSPSFGPDPVARRLALGDAAVLVTTEPLFRRTVAPRMAELPSLRHVLLTGGSSARNDSDRSNSSRIGSGAGGRTSDFDAALLGAPCAFETAPTTADDLALLHFTSGTTGPPKGALHAHGAVVAHHRTAALALDLRGDDVFWCTADPGWVTGTSYGIVAPLSHGVTSIVDQADFDAARWYTLLERFGVTVWYTSPTALRMLRRAGDELARSFDLRALRVIATVGEPLDAETERWGERVLGRPVHDTWWQTETGAIMIANPAPSARPGSMGRPLPGVEATVLRRGADGRAAVGDGAVVPAAPGEEGELALRPGWPSMFRGYLHDPAAYAACFGGGWYLTGDVVRCDDEGWYWFSGRADDMIKSAGHFIGPFEVEAVLMQHHAVAEAAVVGVPDAVAGEVVQAFVALRPGQQPSEALRRELIGWARARLGPVVAPRDIAFSAELPHTSSGKVLRRALKEGALKDALGEGTRHEGAAR